MAAPAAGSGEKPAWAIRRRALLKIRVAVAIARRCPGSAW